MPTKPYVLFREDSGTHREMYYVTNGDKSRVQTSDPAKAMRFATAQAAYDFGAVEGLMYWKAGRR